MLNLISRMRKSRGSDLGLTLIEVLVGLIITGIISVVIVRVTIDASNALQNSVESLKATQTAVRFSNLIKYDIASSVDAFAFDAVPPTDTSTLCSSAPRVLSNGVYVPNNSVWAIAPTTGPFVRTLITVQIKDLPYDKSQENSTSSWLTANNFWVGYEVRRAGYSASSKPAHYTLWRITCNDSNGSPEISASGAPVYQEQQILDLGVTPNTGAYDSVLTGLGSLTCSPVPCGISPTTHAGASTAQATYYSFAIPYGTSDSQNGSAKHLGIKGLSNDSTYGSSLLQKMYRRVNG